MADTSCEGVILNVDHDPVDRHATSQVLRDAGYTVMEAEDGQEALRLAPHEPVDVVLLDADLPDVSGVEVARRLRADPATAAIPILQRSATTAPGADIVAGLEAGADVYLTEPVTAPVLLATVRALLRRRQAMLRQQADLIDLSPDAIIVRQPDGTIVFWSHGAEALYGWRREEAIGQHTDDLLRTEFPQPFARILEQLQETRWWSGELVHHAKGGGAVTVQSRWLARLDAQGEVREIMESNVDITERKRVERARAEEARFLRAFLDNAPPAMAYLDRNLRFVRVNRSYAAWTGIPAEGLVGRAHADLWRLPERIGSMRHVLATGEPVQRTEMPVSYPPTMDREEGFVDYEVYPVRDEAGDIVGLVLSVTDVTERVRTRERLLAAERSRAELAETLNAEISHRTKNNLAMVASLLQMQAAEEQEPRLATALQDAATRLLTFASIHEQMQVAQDGEIDLLAAVSRVAEATRELFTAQEMHISVEGASTMLPARSATNLAVLVNELITNAAKHGGPGRDGRHHIHVRLGLEDGTLQLRVWNSGPPLPAGFDPHESGRMGLRLVQGVVDQYAGTFDLRATGRGTVAEVTVAREQVC